MDEVDDGKIKTERVQRGRIRTTKQQYLEQICRILTGRNVMVQLKDNRSCVKLSKEPIQITLPENMQMVNKAFISDSPNHAFDIEATARELGYDVETFKLFMQRLLAYHECSHVEFTQAKTAMHQDEVMANLVNFFEDARVEKLMSCKYPPAEARLELMNKIMLSRINLKKAIQPTLKKEELARIATIISGWYRFGLASNEPQSPVIRRMVEILDKIDSTKKTRFRDVEMYAQEVYDLLQGLSKEELKEEIEKMQMVGDDGLGDSDNQAISDMEAEIANDMGDLEEQIKGHGIEMKNRDLRNTETVKYQDQTLITYLTESLRRIIGGKPSRANVIDYDGQSLDIEGYLEWQSNPEREIKMYERSGKRIKPQMFITLCIDSSGSMSGGNIEIAKKSAINLAYACERVGIHTCIMDFATDTKVYKQFDMPIKESEVGQLMAGGGTDISIAVRDSVKLMGKHRLPENSQCALIVLSDGCDGTAKQVARYLDVNNHVHFYMIGIHDNPTKYVHEVREGGGKCYGYAYIQNSGELSRTMQKFVKDFVRRA